MSFQTLGLIEPLCKALSDIGFTQPTEIQKRTIGLVFAKHDIFATAQTGTGKTAAFLLPAMQHLNRTQTITSPRLLIIAPTRELALQIDKEREQYGKHLSLSSLLIIGGKKIESQQKPLKKGIDIIIATPGRLKELIELKSIDLMQIQIFVIDEADRMLDMGFSADIRTIHTHLPKRHQTLLFSATYSEKVRKLSRLVLTKPSFIETAKQNAAAPLVEQIVYRVDAQQKAALLAYLIGSRNIQKTLVFTKTKASADALAKELLLDGLTTEVLHGDKTHAKRKKALDQFQNGAIRVLVATDIASRGLDIEQLPHVINYELPALKEDYIHRIGRTGRAGNSGKAITLLDKDETAQMRSIEKLLGTKISQEYIEGFEPADIQKTHSKRSTKK
jgi:ATP-dependent RNA helicase RhlE